LSFSALALVLAAAGVHATWNLLAKRAGGGATFVWMYAVTSAALWAPVTIPTLISAWPRLDPHRWVFLVGSGILHMIYFLLLQRGYARADLSVVYPVARGSGPLLSTAAAMAIYHERPGPVALIGIGMIVLGIGLLARPAGRRASHVPAAIGYGLATGALIGLYTIWDKQAVAALAIPPLLMEWITSLTRAVLLLPIAWRRRTQVIEDWRARRGLAIAIGALNPLSYLLVLIAMTFSPVSRVAPAREISVVIGVFFGVRLLGEGDAALRLAAAGVTVCGVILLAVG
jgi:drug/metabolite transporter (DMT)-like permease